MATSFSAYRAVAPALVEQRADPRHRVRIRRASVRRHGTGARDAALLDLSCYGCRIESGDTFEAGERLWLRLDGGMPVAATVAWSSEGRTGCRFDEPIDGAMVRALTLVIR